MVKAVLVNMGDLLRKSIKGIVCSFSMSICGASWQIINSRGAQINIFCKLPYACFFHTKNS
jgi:hypothetical protein